MAHLGLVLLGISAAGLLVRRRVAFCRCYFVELLAMMTTTCLFLYLPERFFNFSFYAMKETVYATLCNGFAIEIWLRNFSRFPKARVRVGLLLCGALLLTAVAVGHIPGDLHPYDAMMGILVPRLHSGTLLLFAIVVAAAKWYGVPLHPLHRAILVGAGLALLVQVCVLSLLGWAGGVEWLRRGLSLLNQLTAIAAETWLAWAAWRPLRAPTPVLSRLQPWAHTW